MPTTNSRWLTITGAPPNINTGFQIRVLSYKDGKSLIAVISQFNAFAFTDQLNDPGTGSITLDADNPFYTQILGNGLRGSSIEDREYVFEITEHGTPRFSFLGTTVEHTTIGEDETRVVTISGPGIAHVLSWACIMRPGWPRRPPVVGKTPSGKPKRRSHSFNDNKPAYIWQFPMNWPTMRMWWTTFKAAQRRGLVKQVVPLFSATAGTDKKPWIWIKTLQSIVDNHGYQPEALDQNLLDFLNQCSGQETNTWFGQHLEWKMYPGFRLDVRTHIGTDRSKNIRFYKGQILNDSRTRDREAIYNRITAVDVEGSESIRTDTASVKKWNLREQRNEANKNITDNKLRGALADKYLDQSKDEKSQWTIRITYGDFGRQPYSSFFVGDHIGLALGDDNSISKFRVMAISLSQSAEQPVPDVELTLESILDSRLKQLELAITKIVNEPNQFNLDQLKNVDADTDSAKALAYNPDTGKWEASDYNSGSGTGGPRVFIQSYDPATEDGATIAPGDFWLETYD